MKYPENELAQIVIASCVANHVSDVVISPGSRNAPLTIGFNQVSEVNTYSIVDERCAAFVALGMAQKTQKATAMVCTSGSALLNYYPAVAEAFYADIPLVVISADRPKHMIDIGDGQTIRQEGVFKNHILFEANLRAIKIDEDKVYNKHLLFNALEIANKQKGPVHINVPFDEPLYKMIDDLLVYPKVDRIEPQALSEQPLSQKQIEPIAELWNTSKKKIVLLGVYQPSELLQTQLNHLLKDPSVLVLTESTSNINHHHTINSIDQFLAGLSEEEKLFFQPDILLTIGGLIVSKRIKQYLRAYKPKYHFAIHPKVGYDTFNCLSQHIRVSPEFFFSQFFWLIKPVENDYQLQGLALKEKRKAAHQQYVENVQYSDFKVFDLLNNSLPSNTVLQLSNSATIRYAQLFDIDPTLSVFCNRGTSGIDGSTSTAIGYAMKTEQQVVLITGDLSFLYDSNALWNKSIPSNFRIILVNNNGGGIFKILPGPKQTSSLSYFETPHGLNAEHLAKMYGFTYQKATNIRRTEKRLKTFYKESKQPKILEVFTPSDHNDEVLNTYFEQLKV